MPKPDPHRCAVCEETYPVPSLARDCEKRHQSITPVGRVRPEPNPNARKVTGL